MPSSNRERAGGAEHVSEARDRRRPGRPEQVSPELIPILRGQFDRDLPPDPPGRYRWDARVLVGAAFAGALIAMGLAMRLAV